MAPRPCLLTRVPDAPEMKPETEPTSEPPELDQEAELNNDACETNRGIELISDTREKNRETEQDSDVQEMNQETEQDSNATEIKTVMATMRGTIGTRTIGTSGRVMNGGTVQPTHHLLLHLGAATSTKTIRRIDQRPGMGQNEIATPAGARR